ncbi:DedA family protein, partial [Streptomyces sp. GTA36]
PRIAKVKPSRKVPLITAGVSGMKYRSFLIFNVVGGILWGAGVTLLGSWLGQIDFVKKNIEPILLLIVFISVVPIIIEFMRARSKSKKNPQQQPPAAHMPPAPHVMDDQTTQLRRIPPAHQNGQDDYYGNNGHGHDNGQNQQYQQQPYPQDQGYGGYPQGQDQYAQQYPQNYPPQNQQQYPQDPYPQDQNQGYPYGQNYPQN